MNEKKLKSYGEWAVVTGASDGIGKAIAEELAGMGINLVLVARRKTQLEALAIKCQDKHKIETRLVSVDLSHESSMQELINATKDLDVGLLVAAAGFGTSGDFVDSDLTSELNMIDVNCRSVVQQCKHFAQQFKQRQRGAMILCSSLFAFQGVAGSANYAATKAFIQSFAEALSLELKPHGVDVLSAAYGPVKTGFAERADMVMSFSQSSSDVARATLSAVGKKSTSRPGFVSKFLGYSLGCLPRRLRTIILSQVVAGMTAHQITRNA